MQRLFLCLAIATIVSIVNSFSANLFSIANGNWSGNGVWSYTAGGASCNCSPIASDNVTINHTVNMDKHLTNVGSNLNGITGILTVNLNGSLLGGSTYDLDIRSTGQLHLCGTLTARDMTFSNGSIVNVCSTGNLSISRDFFNKNNSNSIVIDGNMTVGGEYENGNGGVISGSGTINITNGPVTNTGSTYGCEGFDPCNNTFPCQIISPCLSPLPVSFLSLQARWLENNHVLVSWSTGSEINNAYFDVLRSEDGKTFQSVGRIMGNGTSSQVHHYSLIDKDISPLHQLLYYRIRQVDFDGQSALSSIVVVSRKSKESGITVYPNPFEIGSTEFLNVTLQNISDAEFVIVDAAGKLVYKTSEKNLPSFALVKLPLPHLASGMYTLKILTEEKPFFVKVVVYNGFAPNTF